MQVLPHASPSRPARCLLLCVSTTEVGEWLLTLVRQHDPTVTADKLLKLEFICEDTMEMPLVWITAHSLFYMWGVRAAGNRVDPTVTRATLESKISILRKTRYQNEATLAQEIIENTI